jgi:hypothetical protein
MDHLAGVRLKIERAEKHIRDLDSGIRDYFQSRPYEVRTHRDPDSRRMLYVLHSFREPDETFPVVVGDVIQNLRSALDHMAYLLFKGSPGFKPKLSFFPIAEDAAKYKSETLRKIKGFRKQPVEAISAIEPYGGGKGETLWRLHSLNIVDKHQLLIPVLGRYGGFIHNSLVDRMWEEKGEVSPFKNMPPLLLRVNPEFSQLKVGAILFADLPDAKVNQNMQFKFDIAFNEPGIAQGEPVLPTLQGMHDFVKNVITDLGGLL